MALARGGVLALTFAVSASALCADLKKRLAEVDYDALAVGSDIRLPAAGSGPQQVHLSLTGDVTEMYVTFVTPESALCADAVATLLDGDKPPSPFPAKNQTYSAGIVGWTGVIYTSTFTGLMPGAFYSYTVRACGTETTPPFNFTAARAPGPNEVSRVAVTADMGTVIPLGYATAARITDDSAVTPFDMAMISGDLSYATTDPPKDEAEEVWDAWGRLIQPYAAFFPFMANVGNHEHTPGTLTNASGKFKVDYAAYEARYGAVPATGNGNLWYSFNHGPAHYVFGNSEDAQSVGSPQHTWIAADLAAVDRGVTPWVIYSQHRPFLCSTKSEAGDHTPGGTFLRNLEPLFLQYNVDLVLTGHEHLFERTNAYRNGTVVARAQGPDNTYTTPGAPIYIVQGTAGAFVTGDWADPQPEWSASRNGVQYGYGNMLISGAHTLAYKFVSISGEVVDHFVISK